MTRKSKTRLFAGLAAVAGVLCLVLLSVPLWFQWALRPIASRYAVHYSDCHVIRGSRAELRNVQFNNGHVDFHARRVSLLLPIAWAWHALVSSSSDSFIQVDDWELRVLESTPRAGGAVQAPQESSASSVPSVCEQIREALARFGRWLPHAQLRNGTVHLPAREIHIPELAWTSGTLSTRMDLPKTNQATAVLQLGPRMPWKIRLQIQPADVQLSLALSEASHHAHVQGQLSWQSNQLELVADFGPNGWLPEKASAVAKSLRIPVKDLGLPEYHDLTGSFAGEWNGSHFDVRLQASAEPVQGSASWAVPAELKLQATGTTNRLNVQAASVRAPWVQAELSPGAEFDFSGNLRSPSALLSFTIDLAKAPWLMGKGSISGRVDLVPGAGRMPRAAFQIAGRSLEIERAQLKTVQMKGALEWPWLSISSAELMLAEATQVSAIAKVDLAKREVANAVLHAEGPPPLDLLPAGMSYRQLLLQANAKGPFQQLEHDGSVEIRQLVLPKTAPLDAQVTWRGRELLLESFQALVHASNQVLSLAGSALVERSAANVRWENLSLTQAGRPIYSLVQPAVMTLATVTNSKAAAGWSIESEPLRMTGPGRLLALESAVHWPKQGLIRGTVHNFQPSDLAGFLRIPRLELRVDDLDLAAAWSNSPVRFTLTGAAEYAKHPKIPIAIQARLEGDEKGVAVRGLKVSCLASPVLTGTGFVPITFETENGPKLFQLHDEAVVRLQADSVPNKEFWNELTAWTKVRLLDPKVHIDVSGVLRSPQGRITAEVAALRPEQVSTNWPLPKIQDLRVNLELSQSSARLKELSVLIEGQPVLAFGELPLKPAGLTGGRDWLDFQGATGQVMIAQTRLAAFAALVPKLLAPQGDLSAEVALRPGLQIEGRLRAAGAATRPIPSLGPVNGLETQVRLSGTKVTLETFTGLVGGQPFSITGDMDFGNWARVSAANLPRLNLRVRGDDVPLAREPDLILRSDLNLAISNLTNNTPTVSGSVHLRNSVLLSDLRTLMPGKAAQPKLRPPYFSIDYEPLADWKLAVNVKGDRFLKIRSPFFRGELSTDLKLEGDLQEPVALGEATVNSGLIQLPFATLEVNQGLVSLTSADPYRPQLFVTATGKAFGYDVRMEVTGTADSPVIQFTSTPSLPSEQILLMLTAGELPQGDTSITTKQRASRLAMFLGRNLLSELAPGQAGADRLTVRSGEYLSEQGQQTYSLEYKIDKNWSLIGEYDRFGDFNGGVRWRIYSR